MTALTDPAERAATVTHASPGEWRRAFNRDDCEDAVFCGDTQIASVYPANRDRPDVRPWQEAAANARLMAASKMLYEALKEVVAISDRKHDAWDKAHAAIAKAEGRKP